MTVNVGPAGSIIQVPTEGSEEVNVAATSVAMEAAATVTALDVSVTISVSAAPVVDPTPCTG